MHWWCTVSDILSYPFLDTFSFVIAYGVVAWRLMVRE